MFDNVLKFFKKFSKEEKKESKDTAKERLHLVLMQDRANVSADFMELMKQEIIEVIKKYIDVDENSIDVKLTNKVNGDGTTGVPILYANIPIVSVKDESKQVKIDRNVKSKEEKVKKVEKTKKEEDVKQVEENKKEEKEEPVKEENIEANDSSEVVEDEKANSENNESKEEDNKKEELEKTETEVE